MDPIIAENTAPIVEVTAANFMEEVIHQPNRSGDCAILGPGVAMQTARPHSGKSGFRDQKCPHGQGQYR